MAYADDLILQAKHLARQHGRGRPKQASLRRAVSAAYYALFHEVAQRAMSAVLSRRDAAGPVGARLRRVIQHGAVLKAAKWFDWPQQPPAPIEAMRPNQGPGPADLMLVCRTLSSLQDARQRSDYDLSVSIDLAETIRHIDKAEVALRAIRRLDRRGDALIFLLGCVLGDGLVRNA